MAQIPSCETRFKENSKYMAQYSGELLEKLYNEGLTQIDSTFVSFAVLFINSYESKKLIEDFIIFSAPYWDSILEKDEHFFDKNVYTVFSDYPIQTVDAFRSLFKGKKPDGSNFISQEVKDKIWATLQSLIKISIKYIHRERNPRKIDEEFIYDNPNEFSEVGNLNNLSKKWKVDLNKQ